MKKTQKRFSLLVTLACALVLVLSLGIVSACGTGESASADGAWYFGAELPASELGQDGDYYLDTETLTSYVKEGKAWRAANPDEGGKWYYGTDALDGTETFGNAHDFYLDTDDGELYQKGADGWKSILVLKGKNGRDGVVWFSGKGVPENIKDSLVGDFYLNTEDFTVYQLTEEEGWKLLGTIKGRGTIWFDGWQHPDEAELLGVYEGDYYYRSFVDDEAQAEKYQVYRFENKAWVLKTSVVTADLSALYEANGSSHFQENADGTVTVNGVNNTAENVTIPGRYHGKPVKIGNQAFYADETVKSITIEEGVTEIGQYAFYLCFKLESVKIPASVTEIGANAFSSCSNIKKVTIAEDCTWTEIPQGLFNGCSKLESMEIPAGVTKIGNNAFKGCTMLSEIVIPEGSALKEIGDNAFASSGLKSIEIPDSVTTIGRNAFQSSKLESVKLPKNLTKIEMNTFERCYYLTSLTIPANVGIIGSTAFYNCYRLVEIINHSQLAITPGEKTKDGGVAAYALRVVNGDAESNVKTDKNGFVFYEGGDEGNTYLIAYRGSQTDLTLPATSVDGDVYEVRDYAFYSCDTITSVKGLPAGMDSIGIFAFYNCKKLQSITIPDTVTSIGENAFYECRNLRSIDIPEGVTEIGKSAFAHCHMLQSVTIPKDVTVLKDSVFYCCYKLGNVTFAEDSELTTIEASAFFCCYSLTSITIPAKVQTIGGTYYESNEASASSTAAFSACRKLTEIINLSTLDIQKGQTKQNGAIGKYAKHITNNPGESKVKTDENGFVFYEGDGGEGGYLIGYVGGDTTVRLPAQSVDGHSYKLATYAFYYEPSDMFSNSLDALVKSIEISEDVTEVEAEAIYMCDKLTNLTIEGNGAGLTIDQNAIKGCSKLATVTFGGTADEFDALLERGNFLTGFASISVICNGGTYTYVKGVRQS